MVRQVARRDAGRLSRKVFAGASAGIPPRHEGFPGGRDGRWLARTGGRPDTRRCDTERWAAGRLMGMTTYRAAAAPVPNSDRRRNGRQTTAGGQAMAVKKRPYRGDRRDDEAPLILPAERRTGRAGLLRGDGGLRRQRPAISPAAAARQGQNLTLANSRTVRPGISTSSFLNDTALRMFSFSRLLPTMPTVNSRGSPTGAFLNLRV